MNETGVRTRDHNPRHVAEAVVVVAAAAAVVADLLDGGLRSERCEFEGLAETPAAKRVTARRLRADLARAVRAVEVRTAARVNFSRARH